MAARTWLNPALPVLHFKVSFAYHVTAASTSLTIYRTFTVVAGMLASYGSDSQDDVDFTEGLSRRSIQVMANGREWLC